ncbi:MAG TPA: hypothetical protein VM266_09560 [Solirubrobacteraceae bacterium]|nr:hypothetical protein [Solirubrobacteraceae bacterium]
MTDAPDPTLTYALELLPPGRAGFRRWRWELWHGPRLLATGWRTTEQHAVRAIQTTAARVAHRFLGLHALRPELAEVPGGFRPGAAARVECGGVRCWLVPRDHPAAGATALAG